MVVTDRKGQLLYLSGSEYDITLYSLPYDVSNSINKAKGLPNHLPEAHNHSLFQGCIAYPRALWNNQAQLRNLGGGWLS